MNIILIKKELFKLISDANKEIKKSKTFEELKQIKSKYVNKNERLLEMKRLFKDISNDKKHKLGVEISSYNEKINSLINLRNEVIISEMKLKKIENINENLLNLNIINFNSGSKHPLSILSETIKSTLYDYGYSFVSPIEVESTKINFDDLNIDYDHPSRDIKDTYYINSKTILRPQCTNMTLRYLKECNDDQIKSFTIGKAYRNDTDDTTHSHQFQQIDILNVSKNNNVNISNLKWIINELLKLLFLYENLVTRFRPSFFPFTTPSYEVDIQCSNCLGKGCNVCKSSGWLEILGCGMIHPNVIKNAGKDPKVYKGFAIGIGLERLAMLKWNIKDIRDFYNNDIDFLNQFKGIL